MSKHIWTTASWQETRQTVPHVVKFFRMVYALSPVQTTVIIFLFVLQSLIPAMRLKTESNFIQLVRCIDMKLIVASRRDYVWERE
jgi:hypothetical protein